MDDTLTIDVPFEAPTLPQVWGLAVAWCLDEPERVGEVLVLDGDEGTLGRGPGKGEPRLLPVRVRPGHSELRSPLSTRRLSRRQLELRAEGDALVVRNVGKTPLRVAGRTVDQAIVRAGDVVEVQQALVAVVVRRELETPPLPGRPPLHPFGAPDADGVVGESSVTWALRRDLAFVAVRPGHVLMLGPSGAGKELAARSLHRRAGGDGPWVARNAATIPETLADAELFGNLANYPNAGMPARPGLVGEADGGTLLLDEVGELPEAVQARLLRLLDDGEYQALGEARTRRSSARVLGATHRDPASLKHDLVARFRHRVQVAGLNERRADVPLLVGHLLRQAAGADPSLERFLVDGHPRLTARFMVSLLRRTWHTHVRELDALLWESIRQARGDYLDLPERDDVAAPSPPPAPSPVDPSSLTVAQIEAALADCHGVVSQAYKQLGLNSRDQLRRLMKKHGVTRS